MYIIVTSLISVVLLPVKEAKNACDKKSKHGILGYVEPQFY